LAGLLLIEARLVKSFVDLVRNAARRVPNSVDLARSYSRLAKSLIDLVPNCSRVVPNAIDLRKSCKIGCRT
jgi:hypothetical protein